MEKEDKSKDQRAGVLAGKRQEKDQSKGIKAALQESEERFRKIFDHSNDAIFVIDPEHDKILDANPIACSMLNYSHEELLSTPITAIHPNEMPQLLAFARSVFERGHGWTSELSCITKSGKILPAEISGSVIEIAGETCLLAMVRDITERKQAQEALQKAHDGLELRVEQRTTELSESNTILKEQIAERQRAEEGLEQVTRQNELILQAAGEGIYGLNKEGKTTFVNPAAARMIGWGPEELIGKPQHALIHHSKQDGTPYPREECPIYAAFNDGAIHHVDDEVFWKKDGTNFPVEYTSTPIRENGKLVGAVVVFKDITKRKQAEETLRNALKEVEELKNRLQAENIYLQEEIKVERNFEEIIGQSTKLKRVLRTVEQVAPTDTTVLIGGESGTGKELLARAIHNLSPRRDRPLVKVNCGAIPPGLVESELFGHEKGAFTGAVQRRVGRFELADGGTIFLDEVGELPLDAQVRILRVIQEQEFERVGSNRTVKVDIRVIAATNRNLKEAVKQGIFRSDLFYRLNVFPLEVPPLRERKEDIPPLVAHFLSRFSKKLGKPVSQVSQATMARLTDYTWPGNIREMENVIERATILADGPTIQIDESIEGQIDAVATTSYAKTLQKIERSHILQIFDETNWIIDGKKGAAAVLGLHPNTLRSRMKKLGIKRPNPAKPSPLPL